MAASTPMPRSSPRSVGRRHASRIPSPRRVTFSAWSSRVIRHSMTWCGPMGQKADRRTRNGSCATFVFAVSPSRRLFLQDFPKSPLSGRVSLVTQAGPRMGGKFRCLTPALVEPSCRMGQRLRLPMSATLRMRAAVHGDGRRGTLRDRVPHLRPCIGTACGRAIGPARSPG